MMTEDLRYKDWASRSAQIMAEVGKVFYSFGWLMGTSGNLSMRFDEDVFLITASGKDKGRLTSEDFLLCDLKGEKVHPTPLKPSAETLIHCAIYKHRPQAQAIFHCHDPYAALVSRAREQDGVVSFERWEMIKGLNIWREDAKVSMPIFKNPADVSKLAQVIDEALQKPPADEELPGVLILNHGVYAWGESWEHAKRYMESFAYLFQVHWKWMQR